MFKLLGDNIKVWLPKLLPLGVELGQLLLKLSDLLWGDEAILQLVLRFLQVQIEQRGHSRLTASEHLLHVGPVISIFIFSNLQMTIYRYNFNNRDSCNVYIHVFISSMISKEDTSGKLKYIYLLRFLIQLIGSGTSL